jgi:formate/nitrite transporter FocA (FNT family)
MEESQRKSAHEIFETVTDQARDELERSSSALGISGLSAGITMGLTGIGVAAAQHLIGDTGPARMLSMLLYPLGFVAVIIGRAQLFTENTLYPVVLVLREKRHLANTARLWSIVFLTNVMGALLFALLAAKTSALPEGVRAALVRLGTDSVHRGSSEIFWSAIIGGWIIALVAWLVSASQWSIAQIAVTYLLTYLVGLGHFAHCIAGSGEGLSAWAAGSVSTFEFGRWLALATLGNIIGGVVIVSLLNYGQVMAGEEEEASEPEQPRLAA